MNNGNRLWVVICGNIRDELDFKLTLTRILELRSLGKVDHIVFSTWFGEIDKYDGLREQLKALRVYVLEGETLTPEAEKIPSNSVNYWRQARQLLSALDIIPKTDFVLRVRTDRSLNYINYMDKQGVFENYKIKVKKIGNFPKILDCQIIVFRPRTVRLFQMTDFVLLGQNKDLHKLINFDFYDLYFQKGVVANIQWYAYPFFKEFPVLRDYMRFTRYTQTVPMLKEYVDKNKEKSIFPEIYYKVYAIYLLILNSHFNIISHEEFGEKNRDNISFYHFFSGSPNKGLKYQSLGTIIIDKELVEMAIHGELLKTDAYDNFLTYVKRAINNDENDEIFVLTHKEYKEIVSFFDKNLFQCSPELVWLKKIRRYPLDISQLYCYENVKSEDKLNCLNVDKNDWKKLSYTELIENDLYKLWLKYENVEIETTEKMLLPIARTGNECAIYILIDMLYNKLILAINFNEIIRITLFYLDIRLGSKVVTNITVCIVLVLIKLYDEQRIELKKINLMVGTVLSKTMNEEEIEKILLQQQGQYTKNIYNILICKEEFIHKLWVSVINNQKLNGNILSKIKGDELIVANKKWLRIKDTI